MKRSLFIKFLVLTLTLLVGSLAVTATERPFSLNGTGIAIAILDGNGNFIGAEPTGSGNATHLGMFTNTGKVNFTPDPSNQTFFYRAVEVFSRQLTATNSTSSSLVVLWT